MGLLKIDTNLMANNQLIIQSMHPPGPLLTLTIKGIRNLALPNVVEHHVNEFLSIMLVEGLEMYSSTAWNLSASAI